VSAANSALTKALLLAVDLETTGVNPEDDRVVELGGAYLLAGEVHEPTARMLVDPGRYIPAGASSVHGIRNEDIQGQPAWPEAAARFKNHLDTLNPVLVGYNIHGFDARVINAENARHGQNWQLPRSLDVFVFVNWHRRGAPSRKLGAMCAEFGVELPEDQAHTADADALATGLLLLAMVAAGLIPDDVEGAFAEQTRLCALIATEEAELGRFLYRDRADGTLRIGSGKNVGQTLDEAEEDYLRWLKGRPNLTDGARELLKARLGEVEQMGLF
jgi:DNA polymerase III epsilon subunit-like protein